MPDTIEVAVRFTIDATKELPSYSDTLFIPIDEYQGLNEKAIEALKQARYNNWVQAVMAPPVPEPIQTKDDVLQQAQASLQQAKDAMNQAIDALTATQGLSDA